MLEAVNQKNAICQTTSKMQTEDIIRLKMQISNNDTDNGQPITRYALKEL
jgi:hypothetical protein